MHKPRVVVTAALADDLTNTLREMFDVEVIGPGKAKDVTVIGPSLAAAEGVLLFQALPVTADLLDGCPKLRVISKVGVGYDKIDVAASTARHVLVCNTPGVLSGAVADHTFAMLLALTRRLRENEAHVRSGAWKNGPGHLGHDIRGKTLGILGLGDIGRRVAKTARGFEMDVIYYKRARDLDAERAGLAAFRERDELFRQSDVISVNCALDVTDPEPLDPTDPLCGLPNVVLTPHIGSGTVETRRAMHALAVRNLIQAMAGETPEAAVNPEVLQAR